ncbi:MULTISPECIES: thioredoxin domain-containing protein [unclassified Streptomyces]|uniref:DsbA family protein n=1 Tax=unclassified Streptomyces TaxID=2593676 RepID=UPI00278BF554|nr:MULTISPECIES: thioredoxin domain-containing protein [unclassified Streptomyces]
MSRIVKTNANVNGKVGRAGRVRAAVLAVVLLGVTATACGDDGDGDGDETASPSAAASGSPSARPADDADDLAKLDARMKGDDVIVVGDENAPHTVKVYEDPRCPYCKKFEQGGAQALTDPVQDGDVKVEYVIASFLDENLNGHGSVKAANALRASVEAGKFPVYHSAVYANQPADETTDAYTDDFLLDIADTVDGLRSTAFDTSVRRMRYQDYVDAAMKKFREDGVEGTPTVYVDGDKVTPEKTMYDEDAFEKVLEDAGVPDN